MLLEATHDAIPWDILGNVGAAGIAVLMCVIFMRYISSRDAANLKESAEARREFTASLKEISDTLGKRIDRVHERLDDIHEARRADRK